MQPIDFKNVLSPLRSGRSLPAMIAWWPAALLLLTLFAVPAHAQYSASLQGNVADAQGALIPGADVTLIDKETNRTLQTTSNNSGDYVFSALAPSSYRLEVSRDGFKKKVIDDLKVIAEQSNALNVQLDVGGKAETVTVNASTEPLMDTEPGAIGGTIDQNEIGKLPSFGRDVFQLVQLAPGMFGDGSQSSGGGTNSLPGNQGDGGSGASTGPFVTENKPQVFGHSRRSSGRQRAHPRPRNQATPSIRADAS